MKATNAISVRSTGEEILKYPGSCLLSMILLVVLVSAIHGNWKSLVYGVYLQ